MPPQIITKDPERHSMFHRDVFGWDISTDVVMTPQHLPEGEVMAILRDCEGLTFSVFNSEGVPQ